MGDYADNETPFRFAPLGEEDADAGVVNASEQPALACLAYCVANQQRAGFKDYIDLRQVPCPSCGAYGYNTGWGLFQFACGAEIISGEDGHFIAPCPHPVMLSEAQRRALEMIAKRDWPAGEPRWNWFNTRTWKVLIRKGLVFERESNLEPSVWVAEITPAGRAALQESSSD